MVVFCERANEKPPTWATGKASKGGKPLVLLDSAFGAA